MSSDTTNTPPSPFQRFPTPSGYSFVDEKWKVHTVHPQRPYSYKNGRPCPTRPARAYGPTPAIRSQTVAEKAAKADLALWASCSSVEEYEARKQNLLASKKKQIEESSRRQRTFHSFPLLPPELRLHIWQLAMAEPTQITIFCSRYRAIHSQPGSRCGAVGSVPELYAAVAFLPPLMLVNRESHALASRHYRRVFRGRNGGGGVLTAYPRVVTIEEPCWPLLQLDASSLDVLEIVIIAIPPALLFSFLGVFQRPCEAILAAPNLRRLEIRCETVGLESKDKIIASMDRTLSPVLARLRALNRDWVAPELRFVRVGGGKEKIAYCFPGGLLESMPKPVV